MADQDLSLAYWLDAGYQCLVLQSESQVLFQAPRDLVCFWLAVVLQNCDCHQEMALVADAAAVGSY